MILQSKAVYGEEDVPVLTLFPSWIDVEKDEASMNEENKAMVYEYYVVHRLNSLEVSKRLNATLGYL